jgi:hypothetical protein
MVALATFVPRFHQIPGLLGFRIASSECMSNGSYKTWHSSITFFGEWLPSIVIIVRDLPAHCRHRCRLSTKKAEIHHDFLDAAAAGPCRDNGRFEETFSIDGGLHFGPTVASDSSPRSAGHRRSSFASHLNFQYFREMQTTFSIRDCVDFHIAPTSRTVNRLLQFSFFALEAERWALSVSRRSFACLLIDRMRQVHGTVAPARRAPRAAQRAKRLYIVVGGPYSDGPRSQTGALRLR